MKCRIFTAANRVAFYGDDATGIIRTVLSFFRSFLPFQTDGYSYERISVTRPARVNGAPLKVSPPNGKEDVRKSNGVISV